MFLFVSRFAGTTIRDLDRPVDQIRSDVAELETWRDRFLQAIENMSVMLVCILVLLTV